MENPYWYLWREKKWTKQKMCVKPPLLILVLVHLYMMSFLNGVFNIHSTLTNNDYYDKRT